MLIIPPPKLRGNRREIIPVGLQLMSATYVQGSSLTLVFNKAINIAGILVGDFIVNDPLGEGAQYTGRGSPVVFGAIAVRMQLLYVQDIEGAVTTLSVNNGNGIVSSDGTLSFAGVTNMVIPLLPE